MKINIRTFLTILCISYFFGSCDNFGDTNLDPTRPGGENVNLVAITPTMQTQTHINQVGTVGRLSGILMQQFLGREAQQLDITQYEIGEASLDGFWNFGVYTGSMRDCVDMIDRANFQGNVPHTRGVARIYLAVNLGITTNLWGDIPFTEAFEGADNLTPSYDSQEEIYASIHKLLDDAIADLSQNDPQGVLGDLVGADWIRVAHALKARFYMQLTKRDPEAASKALNEIAQAFDANSTSPIFTFENTLNGSNPLARFGNGRPGTLLISDFFEQIMDGDPRKPFYLVESGGSIQYYVNGNADLFWAQFDSPSPLISYAELKFLEAEALFRTGGNPIPSMQEAITANMQFLEIPQEAITTYLSMITGTDLETIITEKYKALYGSNFVQTWNDYRRTGFPALTPNPNGANGNNPSGVIPRRMLYPISERQSNTNAYEAAIANQGGHLMDVDIWAFKD